MIRIRHLAFAAAALLLGVAATSPAEAAKARCGMTIRGKVKLTQDLWCIGQRRGITLVGQRAHLDLNGHSILCGLNDEENPIKLRGQGALIRNGRLRECTVQLLEAGDHKVQNVRIINLEFPTLVIRSNSNEVVFSSLVIQDTSGTIWPVVSVEAGNYNLISDNGISAEFEGLALQANHTIVVNNVISTGAHSGGAPEVPIEVLGNFNRILSNQLWSAGCIRVSDTSIENIVEANPQQDTGLICD